MTVYVDDLLIIKSKKNVTYQDLEADNDEEVQDEEFKFSISLFEHESD